MTATSIGNDPLDHLALDLELPWHEQQEQHDQFVKLIKKVVVPIMVFLLVMPLLPDLTGEEEVAEKVVAKVLLEPPKLEPTPPPPQEAPKQKTQSKRPDAKPKAGANNGAPNMATLSQQLSALRNSVNVSKMQNKNVFEATSGKTQKSSRAMLGKNSATSSSGGLKASDITVNAKGATLAEHSATQVVSSISSIELPSAAEYKYDLSKGKRDGQSIRRTIERFKGSVYSQYTKALRKNPDLAGRFIFSFVVLPDGTIDLLKLESSELGDKELEKELLDKIRQIEFGGDDVIPTAFEYVFTFLPS